MTIESQTPQSNPPVQPIHQIPQQHRSVNWNYQFQQYGAAVLVTVPIWITVAVYLYFRSGDFDFYAINKTFANVAVIMLGIVLLLGPLSRSFDRFDRYVQYRKELGILAALFVVFHAIVSFFFLPERFPMIRFVTTGLWPFVFGSLGTILLVYLTIISFERMKQRLGAKRWWFIQNWGVRLAFIFTILHVTIMKWDRWADWYREGGSSRLAHPGWPEVGLLTAWFMGLVVLVRIADMWSKQAGRIAWYLGLVALAVIILITFLWGRQF